MRDVKEVGYVLTPEQRKHILSKKSNIDEHAKSISIRIVNATYNKLERIAERENETIENVVIGYLFKGMYGGSPLFIEGEHKDILSE